MGSIAIPSVAYAVDQYIEWIPWWPGEGQKTYKLCADGYFARSIRNKDHGSNDQSQDMYCRNIGEFLPAGIDTDHTSCRTEGVSWWGGPGFKEWATCDPGEFAAGFAIEDYGNSNQAINKMRCCGIDGADLDHEDSYEQVVQWSGGTGNKAWSHCQTGDLITGIQMRDHGGNNQSVGRIKCSKVVLD